MRSITLLAIITLALALQGCSSTGGRAASSYLDPVTEEAPDVIVDD